MNLSSILRPRPFTCAAVAAVLAAICCSRAWSDSKPVKAPPPKHEVTEVVLEDWPGFVFNPQANKIVLRADGVCWRLTGPASSPRRWKGTLRQDRFSWLVKRFNAAGFFSMKERYAPQPEMTDGSTTVLTLKKNGKPVSVQDYDGAGPQELWELEVLTRGVAATIYWTDVTPQAKATPTPAATPRVIRPPVDGNDGKPRVVGP